MGRVVLCADVESCIHPELIGLDQASVSGKDWLYVTSSAKEARSFVANEDDIDEAWLVSSDEMDGVNLCAALRKDRPTLPIYLISGNSSGSELSRASQAGVSSTLSPADLNARLCSEARKRMLIDEAESLDIDTGLDEAAYEVHPEKLPDKSMPAQHVSSASGSAGDDPMSAAQTTVMSELQSESEQSPSTRRSRSRTARKSPNELAAQRGDVPSGAIRASRNSAPSDAHLERRGSSLLNPNAFIVSFMSGSGGVGKSAICAVSAYLCASRGCRVGVVDCDLQFGDMHQIIGDVPKIPIDDVLADPGNLLRSVQDMKAQVPVVISAPTRLERSETLSDHMEELVAVSTQAFDVILVNTGSSWAGTHAQLLELSNCSVFVLDQRASSVRTCKHALDLCMRMGIASGSFVYALNRCARHALFTSIDISNAMKGAYVFELKDGGMEVEELLGAGLACELATSKNAFCQSVQAMLEEVLP